MSFGLVQKDSSFTSIRTTTSASAKMATGYFAANVRQVGALLQLEQSPENWVTVPVLRVPTAQIGPGISEGPILEQNYLNQNAISADGTYIAFATREEIGTVTYSYVNVYRVRNNVPMLSLSASLDYDNYPGFLLNAIALSGEGRILAAAAFDYVNIFRNQFEGWIGVVQLTGTGDASVLVNGFGTSMQLSGDGKTLVVGAPFTTSVPGGVPTGCLFVFQETSLDVWVQQGTQLMPTGYTGAFGAYLGTSLALSSDGSTIVAGGQTDNDDIGSVWIYKRQTPGQYIQFGAKISAPFPLTSLFGYSVALNGDGNILAVSYATVNTEVAIYVLGTLGYALTSVIPKSPLMVNNNGGSNDTISLSYSGDVLLTNFQRNNFPAGASWVYTQGATVGTYEFNGPLYGPVGDTAFGTQSVLSTDGASTGRCTALISSSTNVYLFK